MNKLLRKFFLLVASWLLRLTKRKVAYNSNRVVVQTKRYRSETRAKPRKESFQYDKTRTGEGE